MSLLTYYEAAIQRGDILDDPKQRDVLQSMQELIEAKDKKSWFRRRQPQKGLYLYGCVGVGKTFLVDLLFQQLAEKKKARFHFHHFMQEIDRQLRKIQGKKNPLKQIAKELANKIQILCLDEFLVHDVAHAMMLAKLLQALNQYGVILVISSNTAPDDLYPNGVQRDRFLPAIALIKQHCNLIHLLENKDYRRGRMMDWTVYLYPQNECNQQIMTKQFAEGATDILEHGTICVQNRDIPYLRRRAKSIWFDFNRICNLPRCQSDYLDIANRFDTIFLSDVPALDGRTTETLLFIYLIDVLYDRGIRLIMMADVSLETLYTQGTMQESFKRTLSRLMEMQSVDYLLRRPRRIIHEL